MMIYGSIVSSCRNNFGLLSSGIHGLFFESSQVGIRTACDNTLNAIK